MSDNIYETGEALAQYLLFHYGSEKEILPYDFGPVEALEYPARCARLAFSCLEAGDWPGGLRALDLGCAVGRSSFELARGCGEVLGIDFSESFIAAANRLKDTGCLSYRRVDEGDLTTQLAALVPDEIDRGRVSFEQGDACHLREDLGSFHLVHMANLIDRLPDPAVCLRRMQSTVVPGGILLLTSPYTWLDAFTPRANWIGGFECDGKALETRRGLEDLLTVSGFSLEHRQDMPFFIREHARKYQWSVAEATVWRRNGSR